MPFTVEDGSEQLDGVRQSNPRQVPLQILSRSRRLISCKPSGGRELGDPIDREVSQARQDRAKIVANRDLEPPAGFDYRDNRCNARPGLLASDVYPVAAS